jgi:acyl transferase domain-containing protein
LNVNPDYSARGRLAFVWAKPEVVQPLLDQKQASYIAIHMAPEALILGGDRDELADVVATLKKDGCFCQMLPYPPIHTPALSYLIPKVDAALADMDFGMQKAKIALYSSITASLSVRPEGIRETDLQPGPSAAHLADDPPTV